jgi:hypothetical protein
MVLHTMRLLELVPFVVVQTVVLVLIDRLENLLGGVGKMRLEFLPIYQFVTVGVNISKMAIECFGVGHGGAMIRGLPGTADQKTRDNQNQYNRKSLHEFAALYFYLVNHFITLPKVSPAGWGCQAVPEQSGRPVN